MGTDATIAEMLVYALKNPFSGRRSDVKNYQQPFLDGSIITLYTEGEYGRVSLSAKQQITKVEMASVIQTLASLSCRPIGIEKANGFFINRYQFNNPVHKQPLFDSPLDAYLAPLPTIKRPPPQPPREYSRHVWEAATPREKLPNVTPKSDRFSAHLTTIDQANQIMANLRVQNRPTEKPEKLYWQELTDTQCHICHRDLSDPDSLAVMIGPVCRKKIEKDLDQGQEMWADISREELEQLYDAHNRWEQQKRKKRSEDQLNRNMAES